ncbi:probable disease resistance protein At4g27220 [Prosopis cineraria]|uniref:probable disease resistance protein At4g27220 n=1 Tax=Prosopis cineraria TaxID=364024 RepID=UPI00240F397F|nr:probable disease resistance protein At4g27220 [Prosopis cineraria]
MTNLGPKLLSRRLSLRPMGPSEEFIPFKCTEEAGKEILKAVRNDKKIRIGLWGMGGCGKSSLLKKLQKEVEDSTPYKTAFATVSNPPNYLAIQDSVVSRMGLEFGPTERNVQDRAARLRMAFDAMDDESKYLIILDEVWDVLHLEAIGVPVGEKCKVLLGSRNRRIFDMMKFDKDAVIPLPLLTNEDAWKLFQMHAGKVEDSFLQVAQEITHECDRLPVAIKAVASTLRTKELHEWKEAFATLKDRRRPLDIEKGPDNPYTCLKCSIDELEGAEEVSLYSLCTLFPNNSEIAIEDLIRFAFGLGIFLDVKSYERARSKVPTVIDKFKRHSLLLHDEGQCVKMHYMLRALALWEAKNKVQVIMGPRQSLEDLTKEYYMKDTTRLYGRNIYVMPDQLNCPELEILLVSNDNGCSTEFLDACFKGMVKLKVLAIKNTSIGMNPVLLLPGSIDRLKMLRTLCLRGWTLIDISVHQKLEMLHTVELSYCEIKGLPEELANLEALRLLEVSHCKIGGNPYKVLTRCSQLEELYFVENDLPDMVQADQNVAEFFHRIGSFKVLQRYHLEIGGSINTSKDDYSLSKLISVNNFDASIPNAVVKALPQTLEVLCFEKFRGNCTSIVPDIFPTRGECLDELKEFVLRDSDCIKWLIDTTNDQSYQARIIFSKLQVLKVEAMKCLEALCHGPPPSGLFEKLQKMFITNCSQLASLFTATCAQKMVMLEELEVIGCGDLRNMVTVEKDEDISVGSVLPKLNQVRVKSCENLECIMPISLASGLLRLESLEIEDAAKLQYVFGEDNHEKDQNQNQMIIELPIMKKLKLINLRNIIGICPQNYRVKWQLDERFVEACPTLRDASSLDSEIRQEDDEEAMKQNNTETSKGSLHKNPASEESTVGTSSQELIVKQPQVKLEPPQIVMDSQQALEDYKVSLPLSMDPTVLSPGSSITTTLLTAEALRTSSSTNQHPPAEELIDFHGLFKIKARRACLLEEAFVKYPHLWQWKRKQRTPRICKVGYKSLADMLAFLNSETPKTMDNSKMNEFEDLYYELEHFGFDKMWLASVRQRVTDMQASHNNKLAWLDQLESQISTRVGKRAGLAYMGSALIGLGPKARLPQFDPKIEARPLFIGLKAGPVSPDKNKIK